MACLDLPWLIDQTHRGRNLFCWRQRQHFTFSFLSFSKLINKLSSNLFKIRAKLRIFRFSVVFSLNQGLVLFLSTRRSQNCVLSSLAFDHFSHNGAERCWSAAAWAVSLRSQCRVCLLESWIRHLQGHPNHFVSCAQHRLSVLLVQRTFAARCKCRIHGALTRCHPEDFEFLSSNHHLTNPRS